MSVRNIDFEKGEIIFLNGVSSAGKTTLTRALQHKLNAPYYWLSEDVFMEMTPEKFVIDIVLDIELFLEKAVEQLRDHPVLLREKDRGDREIGLAEHQLSLLCPRDNTYDVTVDTYIDTTENCADKIIALLDSANNFQAFKTLWEQQKHRGLQK